MTRRRVQSAEIRFAVATMSVSTTILVTSVASGLIAAAMNGMNVDAPAYDGQTGPAVDSALMARAGNRRAKTDAELERRPRIHGGATVPAGHCAGNQRHGCGLQRQTDRARANEHRELKLQRL